MHQFRNLNQACPKDNFSTPLIDHIIDACTGHKFLSLMDDFFDYNQIHIHHVDQCNTKFTSPWGTLSYRVMPFGLQNAGATFQQAIKSDFHDLSHISLSYLDNPTTRSKKRSKHLEHLQLVFQQCRRYNIWLNPLKCVLCVTRIHLHFFIISNEGITLDPLKVQDINEIPPPKKL